MRESIVKARAVICPNCGGSTQLRGFGHTLSVTCSQCGSLLDTSSGAAGMLKQYQSQQTVQPDIPLGSRGAFDGVTYEVIGFQQRFSSAYGENYFWDEYVLFHPYRGFRYLLQYNGHWNFIWPAKALPADHYPAQQNSRPVPKSYSGKTFKPFQQSSARTSYVIGEFPWRLQVGETVTSYDYISPPNILSSEQNDSEVTWSLGRYITGAEVFKAFGMKADPPQAKGVYANQPDPWGPRAARYSVLFVIFATLAMVILIYFLSTAPHGEAYSGTYNFAPSSKEEQSVVSPAFEITGSHSTAVEIETSADVSQNWVYLWISLVNKDTNESFDFGHTLSYYSGYDSDGYWSEEKRSISKNVYQVPPGRYYLRIEPERDLESGESIDDAMKTVSYHVHVRQGGVSWTVFFGVILLLFLPPLFAFLRYRVFEQQRWLESDFGAQTESSTESGGDE